MYVSSDLVFCSFLYLKTKSFILLYILPPFNYLHSLSSHILVIVYIDEIKTRICFFYFFSVGLIDV